MHRPRTAAAIGGLAVAAAIAIPSVAYAQSSTPAPTTTAASTTTAAAPAAGCSALDRWTALSTAAPEVKAYLAAHPDLVTELGTLEAMAKGKDRHTAAKAYFTAHPDERAGLVAARGAIHTFQLTCHPKAAPKKNG